MANISENNKRIAKNTVFLYFRMLFTMGVSLYTSRVVLNTLGVEDFGIYNVVGGVVMMFSFLSTTMAFASTRFITYELATGNKELLKRIFSISCTFHFIIAIASMLLLEIIGVWFLNHKMNIASERIEAANWVFQFAIISFFISIISLPYNAAIIAHEKMTAFAYISILEVSLKLFIVFTLNWIIFDKLKLYAILTCLVAILLRFVYGWYCQKQFEECRKYKFLFDKSLFMSMFNYVGWSLYTNLSHVSYLQGINILLNLFFGVVINTARGIAVQVQTVVLQFVTNFQMAANPQIIKYYAQKQYEIMFNLVFRISKFSFFILFLLCIPLEFYMDLVLQLWLKNVPEYVVLFCRLTLILPLINVVTLPFATIVLATGKLKKNSIILGTCNLLILPTSFIFLRFGYPPEIVFYVNIFFYVVTMFARLYIVKILVNFPALRFFTEVLSRILCITILTTGFSYFSSRWIEKDLIGLIIFSCISAIQISITVFFIGLNKQERQLIGRKISQIVM